MNTKFSEEDIDLIVNNVYCPVVFYSNRGLNLDAKLRIGGRKAPKGGAEHLSLEALSAYIADKKAKEGYFEEDTYEWSDIASEIWEYTNIDKDLKYYLDNENCEIVPKVFTTSTGVDYLIFSMGGDWQRPAIAFFYWDGKTYRLYVPFKGNKINPVTKLAIGEGYNLLDDEAEDPDEPYADEEIPVNFPACLEEFEARLTVIG